MDITPIYELQTRLRSAAIAGVNLLQEDFRLKRAAEAIKPLEGAAPVFAKLNQQIALLLSSESKNPAAVLLDTIALTDAVVCTLGTVEVKGDVEDMETQSASGEIVVNAPYSQIKGLIDALTTSGSGNYAIVRDTYQANPEIFKDYRIRYAMIQALGASYAELADMVKEWLMSEDASIIPLLKKDFDPKGKKDMLRRLEVIAAIAGEKENDFYVQMLENAEKDIRLELIRLLGLNQSNVELLLDMLNTEKGNHKKMVLHSLAGVADDRVYAVFEKMAKKKPEEVCEYLITSTTQGASKIISQMCLDLIPEILKIKEKKNYSDEEHLIIERFSRSVEALIGKSGEDVLECYRKLLGYKGRFEKLAGGELEYRRMAPDRRYTTQYSWEELIGSQLAVSLAVHEDSQLSDFVMEQYENRGSKEKNVSFLSAAALIKLFEDGDCTDWFEEQIQEKAFLKNKVNQEKLCAVEKALSYVRWDAVKKEHIVCGFIHELKKAPIQGAAYRYFERVRYMPNYNAVMEWMMKHCIDEEVYIWTNRSDKSECLRTGEWFYNRFLDLDKLSNPLLKQNRYLDYMKKCGWTKCEGLGEVFAKIGQPFTHMYKIQYFFENLPGDREAVRAEFDAFINLAEQNKIKGLNADSAGALKILRDEKF